jgi:hypothetical protein
LASNVFLTSHTVTAKLQEEEEEDEGEPGRIEIREKDREAEELDFQHARIRKIENLHGLSKIQVLGFRYGTPSLEHTGTCLSTIVADPHRVDADPDPGLFTLVRIRILDFPSL